MQVTLMTVADKGVRRCYYNKKTYEHVLLRMKRTRSTTDIFIFIRCRPKAWRTLHAIKQFSLPNFCSSIKQSWALTEWKEINRYFRNRLGIPKYNGITHTNEQHKPNIVAKQFAAFSTSTIPDIWSCIHRVRLSLKHTPGN